MRKRQTDRLIQLPSGSWIRASCIQEIMVHKAVLAAESHASKDIPARVVIVAQHSAPIIYCHSMADAVALGDKIARLTACGSQLRSVKMSCVDFDLFAAEKDATDGTA